MKKIFRFLTPCLLLVSISWASYAQGSYQVSEESKMVIKGTSSLHDWESEVRSLEGNATLDLQNQQLIFQQFALKVPVKSIKSGKSAMDKNTYEALQEKAHPIIEFDLDEIQSIGQGELEASGKLTIAGKARTVTLHAEYEMNNSKQITLTGNYSLKMTSYGIDPPTAVFGTIKTGDEITIEYTLKLNKTN